MAKVDDKLAKVGLDRSIFPRNLKILIESGWPVLRIGSL